MNQESEGSASIQSDSFREKTCSNSVENIGLQLIFKSLQEVWVFVSCSGTQRMAQRQLESVRRLTTELVISGHNKFVHAFLPSYSMVRCIKKCIHNAATINCNCGE